MDIFGICRNQILLRPSSINYDFRLLYIIRIHIFKYQFIHYSFQSDIIDVNTIFKDLATMVHEQGSMVDSIEQNVESTNIRVHEGTDQLRQAEAYKVGKWLSKL